MATYHTKMGLKICKVEIMSMFYHVVLEIEISDQNVLAKISGITWERLICGLGVG